MKVALSLICPIGRTVHRAVVTLLYEGYATSGGWFEYMTLTTSCGLPQIRVCYSRVDRGGRHHAWFYSDLSPPRDKCRSHAGRDCLKPVLLDAIAHDLRTPLTSIKAAATSLLGDSRCDERQRRELLVVIDQECDRIDRAVGQAMELARLDASKIDLEFERHSVSELLTEIVKRSRTHA